MGTALASGWLGKRKDIDLAIVDPAPGAQVSAWAEAGRIGLNPAASVADIVIIAVKPQVFSEVASEISGWVGPSTLVVSIMAGITLKQLRAATGAEDAVRVMPNTPGAIGRGISVLCAADDVSAGRIAEVKGLLAPLGAVEGPVDEKFMSAVTGLSGSGPAYLFLLTEALATAGEAEGLDPALAMRLARATVEGAAALQAASDETPGDLRKAVTSPGGTTQAALDVLMDDAGLPGLMRRAVRAAAARERELSREKD